MHERDVIVVDPMLATGNSAIAAVERLKELQPQVDQVRLPADLPRRHRRRCRRRTPTCRSTPPRSTAQLNEHGYILPGLGDAGDRIFGTK